MGINRIKIIGQFINLIIGILIYFMSPFNVPFHCLRTLEEDRYTPWCNIIIIDLEDTLKLLFHLNEQAQKNSALG